jgi:hypothetical protein
MSGDIPSLPNAPSWCGAHFKKNIGTNLPLTYNATDKIKHIGICLILTVILCV